MVPSVSFPTLARLNTAIASLNDVELLRLPAMLAEGCAPMALARPAFDLLEEVSRPMVLNLALERGLLDKEQYTQLMGAAAEPESQPEQVESTEPEAKPAV